MDFEPMDDFEDELHQAFERRPAPPSLKRKLMEKRSGQSAQRLHGYRVFWQRLAASVALAGVLGGVLAWRHAEEQRRGEAARQQVLTALRITRHALNEMNAQLAAHNRDDHESGHESDHE
ncbi:MAG TPA: hypothetical protein VMV39_00100 [Terracidiphilus sp.]|nr:hypothetical protein [Terracidiphilus sp.]